MLFQGQEFGSLRPFLYFADHGGELAAAVAQGTAGVPAPVSVAGGAGGAGADRRSGGARDVRALQAGSQRGARTRALALHRDLLALRRTDPAFAQQRADRMHGAVLGDQALALRFPPATATTAIACCW